MFRLRLFLHLYIFMLSIFILFIFMLFVFTKGDITLNILPTCHSGFARSVAAVDRAFRHARSAGWSTIALVSAKRGTGKPTSHDVLGWRRRVRREGAACIVWPRSTADLNYSDLLGNKEKCCKT